MAGSKREQFEIAQSEKPAQWIIFVGIAPALSWKRTHRLLRVGCYRAFSLRMWAIIQCSRFGTPPTRYIYFTICFILRIAAQPH